MGHAILYVYLENSFLLYYSQAITSIFIIKVRFRANTDISRYGYDMILDFLCYISRLVTSIILFHPCSFTVLFPQRSHNVANNFLRVHNCPVWGHLEKGKVTISLEINHSNRKIFHQYQQTNSIVCWHHENKISNLLLSN